MNMTTPETLRTYRVGLVIPQCGLNAAQFNDVRRRLAEVARHLPDDAKILLTVPALDLGTPDALPVQIGGIQYKAKVEVVKLPAYRANSWELGRVSPQEFLFRHMMVCDEVWCCPGPGQTAALSKARVPCLLHYAQGTERQRVFKTIPPWVTAPGPPEETKPKPKRKKS